MDSIIKYINQHLIRLNDVHIEDIQDGDDASKLKSFIIILNI